MSTSCVYLLGSCELKVLISKYIPECETVILQTLENIETCFLLIK